MASVRRKLFCVGTTFGMVVPLFILLRYWVDLHQVVDAGTRYIVRDQVQQTLYDKSYMLALKIPEQLTMCTIHFHQFLNVVNDWNLTSVEPFIYHSDMYGLRSLVFYASVAYRFGRLFNASLHNDYLSNCMNRSNDPEAGKPILFEPMAQFLTRSYRELVVIHFMWYWNTLRDRAWRIPMEESLKDDPDTFLDCTAVSREHGLAAEVEKAIHEEIRIERIQFPNSLPEYVDDFKVVRTFCIKKRVRISLRDLKDFVLSHIHNKEKDSYNVSIVFLHWQGRFTQPLVASDVTNYINSCRLPLSKPFHSDEVLKASEKFINSLGFGGQQYLSVHIRFEKVYMYAQSNHYPLDKYMNCCMARLNHLLREVRNKHHIPVDRTLLIWDYSPYGSQTCPLKDCKKETMVYLKQINATSTYVKPKAFNLPEHSGLISLVESQSLYGGQVLVTVGVGSYQTTIIDTFIEQHRDPDNPDAANELHYGHLCIPKEELHGMVLPQDRECSFGS